MKTSHKRTITLSLFIILMSVAIGVLIHGCKKEKEENPAPAIPPASTFVMDFSDFPNTDTTGMVRDVESYKNWWWAATNVGVWNVIITVGLAVPVAAFTESFAHQAVYDPDSTAWVWSYNFVVGGVIHKADLYGSLVADSVYWRMYITKANNFSNFLWYYGKADLLNSGGYWILNKDPLNPHELLNITWHRDPTAGTSDIQYTNIEEGNPENGGYIYYGITNASPYDAFYNIYNKGQDNLTNILWNRTTKDGQVKDPQHFGDGEWHCWDQNRMDIICP